MLGKDITLLIVLQAADWSAACDQAFVFQRPFDSMVKGLILTLTALSACIAIGASIERWHAFRYCVLLGAACLLAGLIGTYGAHILARSVVYYSTTPIPPSILTEGATPVVSPLILGVFAALANALIALTTLIARKGQSDPVDRIGPKRGAS